MKVTVRQGVFETNSSSTHSLTICTKEDYRRWKDGEVYLSKWNRKDLPIFCTEEEALAWLSKHTLVDEEEEYDDIEEHLREYGIYSVDEFFKYINECGFEDFKEEHIILGTEVTAFGYYGHD